MLPEDSAIPIPSQCANGSVVLANPLAKPTAHHMGPDPDDSTHRPSAEVDEFAAFEEQVDPILWQCLWRGQMVHPRQCLDERVQRSDSFGALC